MNQILRLPDRKAQMEAEAQAEMGEIKALLEKSRAARAKAEALIAESQAFLDQCRLRQKRMARQGFTEAERAAIEEMELAFLIERPEAEQEATHYE